MLISPEEAELFFALYTSVIGFAAGAPVGFRCYQVAQVFEQSEYKLTHNPQISLDGKVDNLV